MGAGIGRSNNTVISGGMKCSALANGTFLVEYLAQWADTLPLL